MHQKKGGGRGGGFPVCAWPWSHDYRPSHPYYAGTEHVGFHQPGKGGVTREYDQRFLRGVPVLALLPRQRGTGEGGVSFVLALPYLCQGLTLLEFVVAGEGGASPPGGED